MIINFYNNFANGDVHFSRFIIKSVVNFFPNSQINFLHNQKKGILKDYIFVTEKDLDNHCIQEDTVKIINDQYYINTWYGQGYGMPFFIKGGGTTLKTISIISKNIFSFLNLNIHFDELLVYPSIDIENIKKPNIKDGFNVLICNNNCTSGQANNLNLDYMINTISEKYPHINFYITEKTNIIKNNVIYTSDITNCIPDLVEIGFISTKCNIIVGRASGPYSFSILKENILDENKSFFALCNDYIVGIWDDRFLKCNYYHTSSNDINHITNRLITIIETYKK